MNGMLSEEVIDFADIGLCKFSSTGKILDINRAALRIFELDDKYKDASGIIGKSIFKLLKFTIPTGSIYDLFVKKGKVRDLEYSFQTLNGRTKWIINNTIQSEDPETGKKYYHVLFKDITGLKHFDEKQRLTELQYWSAMDSMKDYVHIVDKDLRLIKMNKAMIRQIKEMGIKNNILGKYIFEPFPFIKNKAKKEYIKVFKTGKEITSKENIKIGEKLAFCEIYRIPMFNNGKVDRVITIIHDVTKEKEKEFQLTENEERFRVLADELPNCIFINKNGKIVYINKKALELTGYSREEVFSQDFDFKVIVVPEQRAFMLKNYIQHFLTGKGKTIELTIQSKKGEKYDNIISVRSIKIAGKKATLGIITDITELKHTERSLKEKEEKFRKLAENSPNMIFIISNKGKVLYANEECIKQLGYTKKDLTAPEFEIFKIVHTDHLYHANKNIESLLKGKDIEPAEYVVLTKYSKEINVISHMRLINFEGEKAILGVMTNIEQKKKEEKELHFKLLFEDLINTVSSKFINISDANIDRIDEEITDSIAGIANLISSERSFIYLYSDQKKTFEKFAEYRSGELKDTSGSNEFSRETFPWVFRNLFNLQHVFISSVDCISERSCKKDKNSFKKNNVRSSLIMPMVSERQLIGILGFESAREKEEFSEDAISMFRMLSDIYVNALNRKKAREELKKSEAQEKAILNNIPDLVWLKDINFVMIAVNETFEKAFGFEPGFVIGKTDFDFCPKELAEKYRRDDNMVIKTGKHMYVEEQIAVKTGVRWFETYKAPIFNDKGEVIGTTGLGHDITERKNYEKAILEEKERLLVTIGSISDGVIATDVYGNIILTNKISEQLTGYTKEEAVGKPLSRILTLVNDRDRLPAENPVKEVIRKGISIEGASNYIIISKLGFERLISTSSAPITDIDGKTIGAVLVARDITDRDRIEKELQKTHKLESLGILAGGIAHDFNNILTGILGNISLASAHIDHRMNIESSEFLKNAINAVKQAKNLSQQLLTFAKGGMPVKSTVSVIDIIEESAGFALSGSNVEFVTDFPKDLWKVNVDEGQISQVINNLIINAEQAMPGGGIISINASNHETVSGDTLPLNPGKYVRIAVSDTGVGIKAEYLKNIFDPFFTTKQKGSGLGLATCYSIIRKHKGYIYAESSEGHGTTFYIYLPVPEKSFGNASGDTSGKTKDSSELYVYKNKRILIMDDEELVRKVAGRMLEHLGCEVDYAKDGHEALSIYKDKMHSNYGYDAVIMDLTVPGKMGGKLAITELLRIDPEAKVIVSSGYSQDPIMSEPRKFGFKGYIAKPYKIEELSKVLHETLQSD